MENEYRSIPLALLFESKSNPRKHYDKAALEELTASVREKGVLEPLIVRAGKQGGVEGYEVVAGHRRFRAATAAEHDEVPCRVMELSDVEALEVQCVENLQRADVHALDEAQGYHALHTRAKFDVAAIAGKIGKSVQYVYDRLKLLSLTKEAQKLFLADRFSAGHAVILARLSPEDQARAIDTKGVDGYSRRAGLWQHEQLVIHPDERKGGFDDDARLKPVSVKELQSWVDEHTKLEPDQVDQMVMPGTAMTLQVAAEQHEKVVRITHDVMTPEEAKGGPPVILGRSWKRADGQRGSKQCERSVIGMVVIGAGRGEALRVCTDKKRCTVHWNENIKAAKKRERAVTKTAAATGEDRAAVARKLAAEAQAKKEVEDGRWEKALPAIRAAFVAAIRKGATGAASAVGKFLLAEVRDQMYFQASKAIPIGKTGDDLLRHLVCSLLEERIDIDSQDHDGRETLAEQAKAFGFDVSKVVDQAAPVEKPAKAAAPAKTKKAAGPLARKGSRKGKAAA